MNNEFNSTSHRNAVVRMFSEFKTVGDQMKDMLNLPYWNAAEERQYDILKDKRHNVVVKLRVAGMFLL